MTVFLDRFLKTLVALCLALMVAVVTWQVVSRYALGDPSPWTEEVARMLLIWVGLLGGAYAYRERAHLGLDLLHQKLDAHGRRRLDRLTDLLCGAFAVAVLIVGGLSLVKLTWELEQTTAVLGIPMAWVYIALPLSGALITWFAVTSMVAGEEEAGQ